MSDIFSSTSVLHPQNIRNTDFKNKHIISVFQKIYKFYQTSKFVDIDLIVGPNTFRMQSHRIVLSASSEYFREAFTRNLNISSLEIPEVDEGVMECILGFMYTSSIHLESHSVQAIFRAAVLFKMSLLIEACSTSMENNINSDNCLGFARLAWEYDKPAILRKSLAFAHDHLEEIRNGPGFFQMTPEVLRELLSSDFLRVDSEEVVLHSLLDWANFDPENRHGLLSDLLSIVRYEMLHPLFITTIRESVRDIPNCDDVIFSWLICHIKYQEQQIIPKIRARNMSHTHAILCGESTEDWNIMTYNGALDTWSRAVLPNSPRKRTYFKSILTEDNRLIIAGGKINGEITASVECLDLQTKTWTALPSMREARIGHIMALIRGSIFVMGGLSYEGNTLLSIERYNFHTRLWTTIGLLPNAIAYSNRYAIVNDRLYIVRVFRPKILKCFDALSFQWTEHDFDHDVEMVLDIAAIGGGDELYLCLVESNIKTLVRFNPEENKWTRTGLYSAGIDRFMKPRMFAFSNKLIFWGKANDESDRILVEMYDTEDDKITLLTPLTELLYDLNNK